MVAVVGVLIALLWLYSEYMLIILALGYLVSGVVARLAYSWSRERRHHSADAR